MSYVLQITAINQIDTIEPLLKEEGVSFKDMSLWVRALDQEIKSKCPNVYCKIMKESLNISKYSVVKSKKMANLKKCFTYRNKKFYRNEINNGEDPARLDRYLMMTTLNEMFGSESENILKGSLKRFLSLREQEELKTLNDEEQFNN